MAFWVTQIASKLPPLNCPTFSPLIGVSSRHDFSIMYKIYNYKYSALKTFFLKMVARSPSLGFGGSWRKSLRKTRITYSYYIYIYIYVRPGTNKFSRFFDYFAAYCHRRRRIYTTYIPICLASTVNYQFCVTKDR